MNPTSSTTGAQAPLGRTELEALGAELRRSIEDVGKHGWSVMPSQREQVDGDWKRVVAALRQCQVRLAKHPKVPSFTISRDENEVTVKVSDGSPRGAYLILSRHHPARRDAPEDRIWLTQVGQPEKDFPEVADGMTELIARIAAKL
jgi:hypothetical protein